MSSTAVRSGTRGIQSDALKRLLVAFGIANVGALALLPLTFYPPFRALFPTHAQGMQTVDFLRICSVVALLTLAIVYGLRRWLDGLIARLNDHMRACAATEPVPLPEVKIRGLCSALGTCALLAGALSLGLAFTDASLFQLFITEDYPLEYASVLAWLTAALCAAAALVVERHRFRAKLVFYVPLILFFVVCLGEESSWGQRMFAFRTPPVLQALNTQGEMTLHNIGSTTAFAHAFLLITVGFFIVLPRLLERRPEWAACLRFLNAPVLHPFAGQVYGLGLLVWIIVGLRFGTLGFSRFSLWGYYTQMDDEVFEFFAALAFLTFIAIDLAYRVAEARLVTPKRSMKSSL